MPTAAKPKLGPRRRPSQARARGTVEVLLTATARVLVRRGWAGTTTNHIAEAAGVSVGTLYEYFPGKDAMVHALVERHLARAEVELGAVIAEQASNLGALRLEPLARAMVDAMIGLHAEAPRLHRVLFEEVPHGPAVRRRVRALEERSASALAAALAVIPGVVVRDRVVAARLVVDMLEALTHRWVTDATQATLPPRRLADELVRMIVAYLGG
ncbi:MAG: TetR/AcrR family transcriptional regulator [Myxococcales bacterium]|nr:TetR/AcrR family transcriptional regulator [Myxococcales bacterium]